MTGPWSMMDPLSVHSNSDSSSSEDEEEKEKEKEKDEDDDDDSDPSQEETVTRKSQNKGMPTLNCLVVSFPSILTYI